MSDVPKPYEYARWTPDSLMCRCGRPKDLIHGCYICRRCDWPALMSIKERDERDRFMP